MVPGFAKYQPQYSGTLTRSQLSDRFMAESIECAVIFELLRLFFYHLLPPYVLIIFFLEFEKSVSADHNSSHYMLLFFISVFRKSRSHGGATALITRGP